MAVTIARPQRVSPVPGCVFGVLGRLLFGYDLGVAAATLLCIKPEFCHGSVQEAS
jgi:hypothetical protein